MSASTSHTKTRDTLMTLGDARRWARIGVLAALAVVVGWVETFIPLPVPIAGVKLGLANIVVLVTLVLMGKRAAGLVAIVKVLATGFLFGNPLMMMFSAIGTALAYIAMVLLIRVPGLHIAIVSVVAAMAHNIGQLAAAQVVLGTPLVWYSAPFMLLAACVTGALCGFAAAWTLESLRNPQTETWSLPGMAVRKSAAVRAPSATVAAPTIPAHTRLPAQQSEEDQHEGRALSDISIQQKILFLIVFFIVAFHVNTPISLAAVAVVALTLAIITGVRLTKVVRVLIPLLFIVVLTVIMQLWYHQEGLVLAQIGPLFITDAGVWHAIRMMVAQASVVIVSVAFMQITDATELVSAVAGLLQPLQRFGIQPRGIVLSLTVALAFIPVLVREFTTMRAAHAARGVAFDGDVRQRLASYARLFAPLVRSSFRHADSLAESLLSRVF